MQTKLETRINKNSSSRWIRKALLGAVLVVALGGAANAGVCISAGIDEPIRLPDGKLHESGTLKLCLDRDYSPVASLHLAFIDNESIGMLTSRRDTSEGAADAPFMMFVREQDGFLQLYGYALPGGEHMNTYLLQPQRSRVEPLRVAVDTSTLTAMRVPAGAR